MNNLFWKRAALTCGLAMLCSSWAFAQTGVVRSNDDAPPPFAANETDLPPTPVGAEDTAFRQQIDPVRFRYTLTREDYKNDWRQAGVGEDRLGERLRSHIVRLNGIETVKGSVNTIEGATGELKGVKGGGIRFVRNGQIRKTVMPKPDGSFSVDGLDPGVYSVIAAGPEGFFAWSIDVRGGSYELTKNPSAKRTGFSKPVTRATVNVQTAAVPKRDFAQVRTLMRNYLPSEESTSYIDGNDVPPDMRNEPPSTAEAATSLKHHEIRLTADGRFLGRVRRLQPDSGRDLRIHQLNVYLIKEDQTVAQQAVAQNGTFAFVGVKPGVYSMVAVGRDGFLALSVDVLKAKRTDATVLMPTSTNVIPRVQGLCFDVALCPPVDCNPVNVQTHTDGFLHEPGLVMDGSVVDGSTLLDPTGGFAPIQGGFAGPGAGFTAGGVGGGVGGTSGGGLAGVLLGTGIGVLLLSDDDDSRRRTSSPATP